MWLCLINCYFGKNAGGRLGRRIIARDGAEVRNLALRRGEA
jgi:hypothetical protein